jgi:hypothetical protein
MSEKPVALDAYETLAEALVLNLGTECSLVLFSD